MPLKITFLILLITVLQPILQAKQSNIYRPNKDHALFFAIQDYQKWTDLRNPISDAEAIAKELRNNYDFQTEVVRNPTRQQIYAKLNEYLRKSYASDGQLFIFFSGHGHFNDGTAEGFFIPRDAAANDPFQDTYIPHTRLERIIDQIPCPHILLNIDACFSGTFDADIALNKDFNRPGAGNNTDTWRRAFIRRKLEYKSRIYITSGGKERTSDGLRYSPFTEKMLEGLRNFGGDDGILTNNELLVYMEKANPTPRSGQFGSHEPGGSFLFISTLSQPGREALVREPIAQRPTEQINAQPGGEYEMRGNTMIDLRDRTEYTTQMMKDGNRWMASNLNYATSAESHCFNNQPANCNKYGRLYSWEAALQACPEGWHLPSDREWREMAKEYGGADDDASDDGKAAYSALIRGGESEFAAQLGGLLSFTGGYGAMNVFGLYWSSTAQGDDYVWDYAFNSIYGKLYRRNSHKAGTRSVRCIQD